MTVARSNASDAVLALFDQALVSGTSFLMLIASARLMPTEEFGRLFLAWTAILFGGMVQQALLLQPLAALYAEIDAKSQPSYLYDLDQLHRKVLIFFVLASAALMAAEVPAYISAAVLLSPLRAGAEFHRRAAYVCHQSANALKIDSASWAPVLCLAAYGMVSGTSITAEVPLLAMAGASLLGWIAGICTHARTRPQHTHDRAYTRAQHWIFGKWVLLGSVSTYAASQLLPFFIAGLLGLVEVAAFGAARSIIGATHVIMAGLDAYGTPRARSAYLNGGWPALLRLTTFIGLAYALTITPILVLCAFAAPYVLSYLIGPEYIGFAWVLQAVSAIYAFTAAQRLLNLILNALKEPRVGAVAYVLVALLSVTLSYPVIQAWGLHGAVAILAGNSILALVICLGGVAYIRRRSRSQPVAHPAI